jgi:hypothetical protein
MTENVGACREYSDRCEYRFQALQMFSRANERGVWRRVSHRDAILSSMVYSYRTEAQTSLP